MRLALALAGVALAVGAIASAIHRAYWSTRVRESWLRDLDRRESRNDFHGVSIRWPINKVANEQARFNTYRLRRRA